MATDREISGLLKALTIGLGESRRAEIFDCKIQGPPKLLVRAQRL
jgi:hypothetical protein